MASIIRMPGETDAEYQRRTRPFFEFASTALFRQQILKITDNNNAITKHLKVQQLRESCGVTSADVFTWDAGDLVK